MAMNDAETIAQPWLAKDVADEVIAVKAHDPSRRHRPMLTTADLSLRYDPNPGADRATLPAEP